MDEILHDPIWGSPKIRGNILGVPLSRIIVFGVYIGVPLFWETPIISLKPRSYGSAVDLGSCKIWSINGMVIYLRYSYTCSGLMITLQVLK